MALAALGRFGSLPLSLARDRVLNLTRCAPKLCRSFRLSAACVGERMGLRRQFFVDSCQLESSLLVGRGLCRRCHGAPSGATNAGGGGLWETSSMQELKQRPSASLPSALYFLRAATATVVAAVLTSTATEPASRAFYATCDATAVIWPRETLLMPTQTEKYRQRQRQTQGETKRDKQTSPQAMTAERGECEGGQGGAIAQKMHRLENVC